MFLHPSIQLELALQRQQALLADAERHRLAKASAGRKAVRALRAGGSSDSSLDESSLRSILPATAAEEVSHVLTAADHFGHRESDDIVVDLFWSRELGDEFRIEVEDRREHVRFRLHARTGKEAIDAFYHPLAVARRSVRGEEEAA